MTLRIRTILCPIDIDDDHRCGFALPVSLAERFGAKLAFCHVVDSRKIDIRESERMLEQVIEDGFDRLDSPMMKDLITYEEYVVDSANISEGITDLASEIGAELIVMCSSHNARIYSLLGSISERVCRSAPCAVLLTDEYSQSIDFTGFQRLMVAYDFSLHSELALQYAMGFASVFTSDLNVIHVLPDSWGSSHHDGGFHLDGGPYHETMTRLRTAVTTIEGTGEISFTVKWGRPYREILNHAAEDEVDMILMGAQGADFGLRTLFGSNVDRVVRQAGRMVLVAHPLKPMIKIRDESRELARGLNPLGSHG